MYTYMYIFTYMYSRWVFGPCLMLFRAYLSVLGWAVLHTHEGSFITLTQPYPAPSALSAFGKSEAPPVPVDHRRRAQGRRLRGGAPSYHPAVGFVQIRRSSYCIAAGLGAYKKGS